MNETITFSVDLEVELTQWKIGLEIFDLAIVCRENPEIRFESSKQVNLSEKRLLTFSEYAPIMIKYLSTYCQNTPHKHVYFLAHNGFPHDYIIILDNLERSGHLPLFSDSFHDSLFLDSLSFFKSYKNNHKGQFLTEENQQVSLSLTTLCSHFLNLKYYAHTAMSDAESLLKLMDHVPRGTGGFSFLMLNEHKDYSDHCKTFSEVSEIFLKRKKLEEIRHVPGYGPQYKQMEVELSGESVNTECLHALLDQGINFFSLVELGEKFSKEKIDEKLKAIIWSNAQRSKIVNWCLKVGRDVNIEKVEGKSDEILEEEEEEEIGLKEIRRDEKQKEMERQKTKKLIEREKLKQERQEENLIEKERKRTEKFIEIEKQKEEKQKEKEKQREENQKEKERQKEERLKEKEKQKEEKNKKQKEEREIQKEEKLYEKERQRTEKFIEMEKQREEKQKEKEKQREEKLKEKERQKEERLKQRKEKVERQKEKGKDEKEKQKEKNDDDKNEKEEK